MFIQRPMMKNLDAAITNRSCYHTKSKNNSRNMQSKLQESSIVLKVSQNKSKTLCSGKVLALKITFLKPPNRQISQKIYAK